MQKIATREAYGQILVELGQENQDIVVLDADLAKSTKTASFGKKFPHRFFDMGIAEQNMIGTAAGLALTGKIPFASTFAVFATGRAFEQIRNSVAYPRLNVKIVATHAGITVGEDGASHQSVEDIALMRSLPNMTVIVPADATETARVIRTVARQSGPVYIRLGRPAVPLVMDDNYRFSIGRFHVVRQGKDAVVFACGIMLAEALEAAEILGREGKDVMVVNASSIKPLDVEAILKAARRTGAVVTAEEHSVIGGLGSAVAEVLSEHYPVPVERVGIRDTFGESGTPGQLLTKFGLTAKHIVRAINCVIAKKQL